MPPEGGGALAERQGAGAMADDDSATVAEAKRDLDKALAALAEPGAGARANLECRVDALQVRLLDARARSLGDVEARLMAIRDVVAGLGEGGYLLNLVDAALGDVRGLMAGGESDRR